MTRNHPSTLVRNRSTQRRRLAACAVVGALVAALAGCSSQPAFDAGQYDLAPSRDDMTEFPLGRYTVPIPMVDNETEDHPVRTNRIEFSFQLYALVTSDQRSSLADAWARHEGKIRDRVIRVCRNASLAELQEPELSTLRAHLADAVQTEVGARGVRRILMTEVICQEL